ncbi:MAG: hypothetical protein JSU72_12895 [Deltaproteobacteria bacterium]|nr:MAG: hypothetical protein JSU72_12895 [Deltaproteobacteria bacterium]
MTTIRGLIIPVDWNDRRNIIGTAVSTNLEGEYLIDQNARGEELIAFLRQKVKVTGFVREDELGKKVIAVEQYEVVEE